MDFPKLSVTIDGRKESVVKRILPWPNTSEIMAKSRR